jgi:hypothetical protein
MESAKRDEDVMNWMDVSIYFAMESSLDGCGVQLTLKDEYLGARHPVFTGGCSATILILHSQTELHGFSQPWKKDQPTLNEL